MADEDVEIVPLRNWSEPFPVERAQALIGKKVKVTFESGDVVTDILYEVYMDTYIQFAGRDEMYRLAYITAVEEVPRF